MDKNKRLWFPSDHVEMRLMNLDSPLSRVGKYRLRKIYRSRIGNPKAGLGSRFYPTTTWSVSGE
jgi:hypothetical protein